MDKFNHYCIEWTKLGISKELQTSKLIEGINSIYPLVSDELSTQIKIEVVKYPTEHTLGIVYKYTCKIIFSTALKNTLQELYPENII